MRQPLHSSALDTATLTDFNRLLVIADLIFLVAIQCCYRRKELPVLLYNEHYFLFSVAAQILFLRSASVVLFAYQFNFSVPTLIVRHRRKRVAHAAAR